MLSIYKRSIKALSIVGCGLSFVFGVATIYNNFVVHNVSISEPTGYYFKVPIKTITVGKRYLLCLNDKEHIDIMKQLGLLVVKDACHYDSPYLLKQVAAKPGDWVKANESGIFINGVYQINTKPIFTARGVNLKPLPFNYNHKLESDEYFVMGTTRTSYDSRYFGTIRANQFYKRAIIFMNDE